MLASTDERTAAARPYDTFDVFDGASLLGEAGNFWSLIGFVRRACDELMEPTYDDFRSELDARSTDKSYDDLLELIEEWFGPQDAVQQYRDHQARQTAAA